MFIRDGMTMTVVEGGACRRFVVPHSMQSGCHVHIPFWGVGERATRLGRRATPAGLIHRPTSTSAVARDKLPQYNFESVE